MKKLLTATIILLLSTSATALTSEQRSEIRESGDKICKEVVLGWMAKKFEQNYDGPNGPMIKEVVVRKKTRTWSYSELSENSVEATAKTITYTQDDDGFESNAHYDFELEYNYVNNTCKILDVKTMSYYCGWASDFEDGEIPCAK